MVHRTAHFARPRCMANGGSYGGVKTVTVRPLYLDSLLLAPPLHTLLSRHSFPVRSSMLPVVDSVLPHHVSDLSVLSKYQALEATPTPTSTSPPRVDQDLAAKFNFADNEESRQPNSTSKSEAADADLDFEYDRMTIVASWRAHANLLMLFVRPIPYFSFLVEKLETPHANHMSFMDGR